MTQGNAMGNAIKKLTNTRLPGITRSAKDDSSVSTRSRRSSVSGRTFDSVSIVSRSSRVSRKSSRSVRSSASSSRASRTSRAASSKSRKSDLTYGSVSSTGGSGGGGGGGGSRGSDHQRERTPKDVVGDVLAPIKGLCTYQVLDNARNPSPSYRLTGAAPAIDTALTGPSSRSEERGKFIKPSRYRTKRKDAAIDIFYGPVSAIRKTSEFAKNGRENEPDPSESIAKDGFCTQQIGGHIRPISIASNCTYVLEEPVVLKAGADYYDGCGVPDSDSPGPASDHLERTASDVGASQRKQQASERSSGSSAGLNERHSSFDSLNIDEPSSKHTSSSSTLNSGTSSRRTILFDNEVNTADDDGAVHTSGHRTDWPEGSVTSHQEPITNDHLTSHLTVSNGYPSSHSADRSTLMLSGDDAQTLPLRHYRDDEDDDSDDTLQNDGDQEEIPQEWTIRGEELLSLDRASLVPSQHPNIQVIHTAFRSTVRFILSRALKRQTGIAPEEVCILQVGSVPGDSKIIDTDSLDLLIMFKFTKLAYASYFRGTYRIEEITSSRIHVFWVTLTAYIQSIVGKNLGTGNDVVWVADFYKHGQAWCIELRWDCARDHEHVMRVDMTPVVELLNYRQSNYMISSQLSGSVFDPVIMSARHHEKFVPMLFFTGEVTASVFHRTMHETLTRISPHILAVLRLMKLFLYLVLPQRLTCSPSGKQRYYLSPYVSPHALQCLLYQYVQAHPNPEDWSVERLSPRLVDLLEELIYRTDDIVDFITRKSLFAPIKDKDITEDIRALIHALIFHDGRNDFSVHSKRPPEIIYVRQNGRLHIATLDTELTSPQRELYLGGEVLVHTFSRTTMLMWERPLVVWCRDYVEDLYLRNQGVDLRKIAPAQRTSLWYRYCDGESTLDMLRKHEQITLQ